MSKDLCVSRAHFTHTSQLRLNYAAVTSTSHMSVNFCHRASFSFLTSLCYGLSIKCPPTGSCLNAWSLARDIILKVMASLGGRTWLTKVDPGGQESEGYTYSLYLPVFFCFLFIALWINGCLMALLLQTELSCCYMFSASRELNLPQTLSHSELPSSKLSLLIFCHNV